MFTLFLLLDNLDVFPVDDKLVTFRFQQIDEASIVIIITDSLCMRDFPAGRLFILGFLLGVGIPITIATVRGTAGKSESKDGDCNKNLFHIIGV